MESLTNKLTFHIFGFLPLPDLLNFCATCKFYHQMLDDIRKSAKLVETNGSRVHESFHIDIFGRLQGQRCISVGKLEESSTYIDGREHGPSYSRIGENFMSGEMVNGETFGIWSGYESGFEKRVFYLGGSPQIEERKDENGTKDIHVFAGGSWEPNDWGTGHHFESIEYLFERTEWFLICKGKKRPIFKMTNAGDNYEHTKNNEREYAHCCPKHQRQMPSSMF